MKEPCVIDGGWVRYDLFTFSFEQSKHYSFIFSYLCAKSAAPLIYLPCLMPLALHK